PVRHVQAEPATSRQASPRLHSGAQAGELEVLTETYLVRVGEAPLRRGPVIEAGEGLIANHAATLQLDDWLEVGNECCLGDSATNRACHILCRLPAREGRNQQRP